MNTFRIWDIRAESSNCYVDFVKDFAVIHTKSPLELTICADTEYVVYCNGEFVARGQYHTFPQLPVYDKIDLSSFLHHGKNRLAVSVYYQGEQSYQYAKGEAGLWFQLHQGECCLAQSDSTVLSAPSITFSPRAHRITPQYGFGFVYNAAKEDNWQSPATPIPPRFAPATEYTELLPTPRPVKKCDLHPFAAGKLIQQGQFSFLGDRQANPALAITNDQLTPCNHSVLGKANPYFIWDLGRETAGLIQFTVDVPVGTVIDLAWGEHINEHGVAAHIGGRNFANRYIAKEGCQTFVYYFRRIAGRYLQMHVTGTVYAIPTAGILEETYPVQMPNLPDTGNHQMNRILHTARETLRQCMHEHYEDCPWREQALYAGDSWNQILCGYYAFHETEFPRANLDLLGHSMRDNGLLAITAPTDEFLQIPSFTFIWIMSMARYLEYTGDLTLIKAHYANIVNTLKRYTNGLKNGIAVHPFGKGIWNFYEWRDGCDGGNIFDPEPFRNFAAGFQDGLYQMFLYAAVKSGLTLAAALDDVQTKTDLENTLSTMKDGIHRVFWNNERQRFASFCVKGNQTHYCQLMQAMALFNDLADRHTPTLCQAVMNDTDLIPTSISYAIYLYEGLLRQSVDYKPFVWQDIQEKWGAMLDAGATTFWETELGAADFDGAGSLCHGWSAVPLYIICRFFLGIGPAELGLQ